MKKKKLVGVFLLLVLLFLCGAGIFWKIHPRKEEKERRPKKKAEKLVITKEELEEEDYEAEEEVDPLDKTYVIAIDPGHQGVANTEQEPIGPGATQTKMKVTGGTTGVSTGVPEHQLNLEVSFLLREELKKRGYEVVMIRESAEVNLSNRERAEIANEAGVDAFLRIHANGSPNAAEQGALTICMTASNPFNANLYPQSRRLSEAILQELLNATGAGNKGVIERDDMSGTNWSKVPVTIVEMGFMSNPEEDQRMNTEEYRKRLVEGMAKGLDLYFQESGEK